MTDEHAPSQPEPEFKTEQPKESTLPWPAIAIGGVFIVVVVGLFIVLSHKPQRTGTSGPSAYAANINLQIQQEELPLQVVERSGPYPQALDLQISPLKPQQPREFRLTLSHISADWNQQVPNLKVMQVEAQ